MNNRGFGIPILLGFIVLAGIALTLLYTFLIDYLDINDLINKQSEPNYENVYTVYMKNNMQKIYNENN